MLFIYSGEVLELDAAFVKRFGRQHMLTTIPATPSDMASATQVTKYLRHVGLKARLLGARYYRDSKRLRQIINNSDAVYLMGGNTFLFLAYARRVDLFEILRDFEADGGIIMAESAGSIILSPNIATALIPTTCPDEQLIELESYLGMGRIPFHISPHFDPAADVAEKELDELRALACFSQRRVVVLRDGEGFIMEGDHIIEVVGQPQTLLPDIEPSQTIDMTRSLPAWAAEV